MKSKITVDGFKSVKLGIFDVLYTAETKQLKEFLKLDIDDEKSESVL